MAHFIDRRLNGKNKSAVNRQRFIRRYKQQIKKAVSDAISNRSVTDISSGESVTIPSKDISEPLFHQREHLRVERVDLLSQGIDGSPIRIRIGNRHGSFVLSVRGLRARFSLRRGPRRSDVGWWSLVARDPRWSRYAVRRTGR